MNYTIENCAGSAQSVLRARDAGAHRAELCAGMPEGGTTPSYGEIRMARAVEGITLHVLIRPRGGDFYYNEMEREIILSDIDLCRSVGVDGVVVGALTPEGDVDTDFMRAVMARVQGDMSVTFHRAFDMCRDRTKALGEIIRLGCARILTSGGAATAYEGMDEIKRLVDQAHGRIIVMPGCGITSDNIVEIARRTGATELHLSARSSYDSPMRYRHSGVSMGGTVVIDEYRHALTDPDKLKAAVRALTEYTESNNQ